MTKYLHAPQVYFPVKLFIAVILGLITLSITLLPPNHTYKQKNGKDPDEFFQPINDLQAPVQRTLSKNLAKSLILQAMSQKVNLSQGQLV